MRQSAHSESQRACGMMEGSSEMRRFSSEAMAASMAASGMSPKKTLGKAAAVYTAWMSGVG